MNVEQARLDTFRLWPTQTPESNRLAKAGFFATGNALEVQCHWCSTKIQTWTDANDAAEKHNRVSPTCPFLVNSSTTDSLAQAQTSQSEASSSVNLMNEQNRLATFRNWPVRFISSQQLARAGFYYFNRSDHVRCAWCQGEIGKWEINDNPFTEHLRFFPNCLWAQLGPNVEVSSEESISNLGIQHIRAPKKERYSSLDARIRSFANWPMSSIQSPNYLATAGFYYQNTDDQVRCFQCNGGLRSWQREDDAWFEHGRWFPKCEFVQLVKGKQYIAQVQQQSRPTLDEALASEPVQKALEMGLNAGRVRAVTKYHLEHFGGPFKCAEALIDAVLDYQREEEHRQRLNSDNDEDDDNAESSSAIVREVGRILDTIFKHSRNTSGTTISASSSLSPTASTSVSNMTTSEDIHPAPQSTRGDTEPTIRVTDDFVVVEIPQRTSSIDSNNQCNFDTNPNEQINSDEWGSAAAYSNITKSNDTKTQQYNQINPTPSTSFVPENCIISNAEVPSTANSAIFEATAHSTQSHSKISQPMESDKSMSLEEENRQLKDARLCKVCMDGDVAVVFLPCGHLVTCVQCAPSVAVCPLCRTAIKAFVRTFLS